MMKKMIYKSASIFKMTKSSLFLMLLAASSFHCNVTSACSQSEICNSYLDVAIDMVAKAKENVPVCGDCPKIEHKPADCTDVLKMGNKKSGIYEIWPMNRLTEGKSINVYCDMDTDGGGWIVFQRRGDFGTPKDYFYKDWKSYKEGFGYMDKDFWLGNDNIFALTNQKLYSARFDMKAVDQNKRFALYDTFWIDDENHKYTLHLSEYSGDAGDSMKLHNNQAFSTYDRENDNQIFEHCAEKYKGAWWYNNCHHANLNGLYHKGKHRFFTHDGTSWVTFKGLGESMEWTEIKIRPKHFTVASAIKQ